MDMDLFKLKQKPNQNQTQPSQQTLTVQNQTSSSAGKIQEIAQNQTQKSGYKKYLILIIILIIIIIGYFAYRYFFGSPGISGYHTVTIKHLDSSKDYLSYEMSKNWSQEAYFPSKTGSEISLYASLSDKQKTKKAYENESIRENVFLNYNMRFINGHIFGFSKDKALQVQEKFDSKYAQDSNYVKTFDKTISDKQLHCWQFKKNNNNYIDCYVYFIDNSASEYQLYSNEKNFSNDQEIFYHVIETTKIINKEYTK